MADISAGVTLQGVDPPDEFVRRVRQIEELGYDYLWVTDSSLHARYVYSYLTLAAVNSERLKIGPNCTHPHTRHPALNVNAMVTINEISKGRGILAVGAGDSPVTELGAPIAKMAEVKAVVDTARQLHTGDRGAFEGPHFTFRDAQIHYGLEPYGPPKVYMTASGPKMLEMAGAIADGVLVLCGAFKEGLEFALEHVRRGAERAGRNPDDIDFGWHLTGTIDSDLERAREGARPLAAWYPMRAPKYCEVAGIPEGLVQEIRAIYKGGEFHEAKKAHALASPEMLDKFIVAGTPDVWVERIEIGKSLGVNHIELFPLADRFHLIEEVAKAVL